MIKVLVVETTKCGYDGITNVIKNFFLYQEDPEIQMDLVTINEAVPELKTFLEQKGRRNYQLPYRNRKHFWNKKAGETINCPTGIEIR